MSNKTGNPPINCEKPAIDVAQAFGGTRRLSDVVGVDASTVSRWCTPSHKGGTGGQIPQRYWPEILKAAKANGIDVDIHMLSGIPKCAA